MEKLPTTKNIEKQLKQQVKALKDKSNTISNTSNELLIAIDNFKSNPNRKHRRRLLKKIHQMHDDGVISRDIGFEIWSKYSDHGPVSKTMFAFLKKHKVMVLSQPRDKILDPDTLSEHIVQNTQGPLVFSLYTFPDHHSISKSVHIETLFQHITLQLQSKGLTWDNIPSNVKLRYNRQNLWKADLSRIHVWHNVYKTMMDDLKHQSFDLQNEIHRVDPFLFPEEVYYVDMTLLSKAWKHVKDWGIDPLRRLFENILQHTYIIMAIKWITCASLITLVAYSMGLSSLVLESICRLIIGNLIHHLFQSALYYVENYSMPFTLFDISKLGKIGGYLQTILKGFYGVYQGLPVGIKYVVEMELLYTMFLTVGPYALLLVCSTNLMSAVLKSPFQGSDWFLPAIHQLENVFKDGLTNDPASLSTQCMIHGIPYVCSVMGLSSDMVVGRGCAWVAKILKNILAVASIGFMIWNIYSDIYVLRTINVNEMTIKMLREQYSSNSCLSVLLVSYDMKYDKNGDMKMPGVQKPVIDEKGKPSNHFDPEALYRKNTHELKQQVKRNQEAGFVDAIEKYRIKPNQCAKLEPFHGENAQCGMNDYQFDWQKIREDMNRQNVEELGFGGYFMNGLVKVHNFFFPGEEQKVIQKIEEAHK